MSAGRERVGEREGWTRGVGEREGSFQLTRIALAAVQQIAAARPRDPPTDDACCRAVVTAS